MVLDLSQSVMSAFLLLLFPGCIIFPGDLPFGKGGSGAVSGFPAQLSLPAADLERHFFWPSLSLPAEDVSIKGEYAGQIYNTWATQQMLATLTVIGMLCKAVSHCIYSL